MQVDLGLWDMLKLAWKLVYHRYTQIYLTTFESILLSTSQGRIKGVVRRTIYDDKYCAFEGIPYAKPPLGELRFRAPQPPEPWTGVLDCTGERNKPLQTHFVTKITEGSEDCLYLNVYAKTLYPESKQRLPVMVWIYGGAFQIGEASRDFYAPDYFMKEDIILVTFNYRLGALGFLSLQDPDVGIPGNAGLKDQAMALQWVKNNISNFSGDPNNITVFGESAGATSVHFLMLSDKTKGLFHKAILQSGTALVPFATTASEGEWPYILAQLLNYKGSNNDKEIYRYLSTVNAAKMVEATNQLLTVEDKRNHTLFAFGPVVEPYIGDDCFISKPCKELLPEAWGNEIPIIIGGTSFEGLFAYQNVMRDPDTINVLGNCETAVPLEVARLCNDEELSKLGMKLKECHFDGEEPKFSDGLFQYLDLLSYKYFWHSIHRTVCARRAYATNVPTYLYRFDFDSPDFNHFRLLNCGKNIRGVSHADDLSYLFFNIGSWKLSKDSLEYKTIERMIAMWTSFAAFSNPNCKPIKPIAWHPVLFHSVTIKCLTIGEKIEFTEVPDRKKLAVWDTLYTKTTLY